MSDDKVTMTEIERATLDAVEQHKQVYLQSGGRDGHIRDFTAIGGHTMTTTLLLETVGAKSGERRISPLIYGDIGGEVVIVASKGGADVSPGWYFNVKAMDRVTIQIATQAYACTWREPAGEERRKIWDFMEAIYPPYRDYQAATEREIPVVVFTPLEAIDILNA